MSRHEVLNASHICIEQQLVCNGLSLMSHTHTYSIKLQITWLRCWNIGGSGVCWLGSDDKEDLDEHLVLGTHHCNVLPGGSSLGIGYLQLKPPTCGSTTSTVMACRVA